MVNYFYLIFATLVSQSGTNETAFFSDDAIRLIEGAENAKAE